MHEEQMKRDKLIVREKLAVGYWQLIPMESWDEFSVPQDTATVRVAEERRAEKKKSNHWWSEANWPRLKEALVNSRYPYLRGQYDENRSELGLDPVPKQTVLNFLRRIDRTPITYENVFLDKKRTFPSNLQVKYVEDIIIKRDTANLGMSSKELIQVISELGQAKLLVQSENHLDCLIWAKRLKHLKRLGRVVSA